MREMRKGMEVMDQEMLKMKNNMEEIAKSHENIMKVFKINMKLDFIGVRGI